MAKASIDLHRYAVIGAQSRLDALQAEVGEILRAFPELKRSPARTITSDRQSSKGANGSPVGKRTRRKMTAAQRKAVGQRMAKYWAKRRKEKAVKTGPAKAVKAATPAAS